MPVADTPFPDALASQPGMPLLDVLHRKSGERDSTDGLFAYGLGAAEVVAWCRLCPGREIDLQPRLEGIGDRTGRCACWRLQRQRGCQALDLPAGSPERTAGLDGAPVVRRAS